MDRAFMFDETFGVNSALNAEVLVAALHAVAMEFDLFGERRGGHWGRLAIKLLSLDGDEDLAFPIEPFNVEC
jgi:hypothetical protein